jgi:hypothetical protein
MEMQTLSAAFGFLWQDRSERFAWSVILAMIAGVALAAPFAPFSLAIQPVAMSLLVAACCLGLAWFYAVPRPDPRLRCAIVHVTQMTLFTAFGSIISYMAASGALPFWDEALLRADKALGLDWMAYLAFVDARPLLGQAFGLAYMSLIPQMLALIIILSMTGRLAAVRTMMLAAILTGLTTVLLSGLMPAMAMYVHMGLTPADFPNLDPAAGFVHVPDMLALRSGAMTVLDIGKVEGIVTFPSYHAALGLILLVAGWSLPWLRWPFAVVNLLLIAATPIHGGHYFIDVAAGLALAAAGLALARRLAQAPAAEEALVRRAA